MRRFGRTMLMAALPAVGLAGAAAAEDAWIRIEAKRGSQAQAALDGWKNKFPDVQSFALPNGMTGIALGPQDAAAAAGRMAQLKAEGAIPSDSYLTAPGGIAPLAGAALAAQAGGAQVEAAQEGDPQTAGQTGTPADPQTADTTAGTAPDAPAPTEGGGPDQPPAAAPAEAPAPGTHIQLQATPGRISANEALAHWQSRFPEAGLWRLPNGMFAIALAPQPAAAATERLAQLKSLGSVPRDTYLATTAQLGTVITAPQPAATVTPTVATPADAAPEVPPTTAPAAQPAPAATTDPAAASTAGIAPSSVPEETPAEPPAPAVMPPIDQVQAALRWAGFYDGPVDGKSGPGTRTAIEKEIAASENPDQPPAEAMVALIARREAWRAQMGLTRLEDSASGLGLIAPMDRLAFDRVERGLSIYGPKDESGAALILYRQPGAQQEMLDFAGLVTALGWVPQPQRTVSRGGVRLAGHDDQHRGHAEARVVGDQVEGWVLIWPEADAENADRLAVEASESFGPTATAEAPTPDASAPDAEASGGATAPVTPPAN